MRGSPSISRRSTSLAVIPKARSSQCTITRRILRVLSTGVRSSFRPGTAESSRSMYSACLTHWRSMASKSSREYFFDRQPGGHHFFAPDFHWPSQRIGVRARIQRRGLNQIPAPGQNPRALRSAHVLAAADADEIDAEACQPPNVVPRRQHVGRVDYQRDARPAGDLEAPLERDRGFPSPVAARAAEEVHHRRLIADRIDQRPLRLDVDDADPGVAHRVIVAIAMDLLDDDLLLHASEVWKLPHLLRVATRQRRAGSEGDRGCGPGSHHRVLAPDER